MITIPDKYSDRAYASPNELAELLGISRETWYRKYYPYVRSGRIQALKVGSALRIRISSFLAIVEQEEAAYAA